MCDAVSLSETIGKTFISRSFCTHLKRLFEGIIWQIYILNTSKNLNLLSLGTVSALSELALRVIYHFLQLTFVLNIIRSGCIARSLQA